MLHVSNINTFSLHQSDLIGFVINFSDTLCLASSDLRLKLYASAATFHFPSTFHVSKVGDFRCVVHKQLGPIKWLNPYRILI